MNNPKTVYRMELANKIVHGRVVGNLYGVARLVDGRRYGGWVLTPQPSRAVALRRLAAAAWLEVRNSPIET